MTAVAKIQRAIAMRAARSRHPFSPAAEQLAHQLVAQGAILTVPAVPPTRFLVGNFRWLEPRRIFWFTACGNSVQDAHVLDFDDTHALDGVGIGFLRGDRLVGYLTRIEHAGVEDPDDYRIAWQFWQEVAPLRTRLIEQCCAALGGESHVDSS